MSPLEIKSLHGLARNEVINNPLTRLALRYWWFSIPIGLAVWGQFRERNQKGEVKLHHLIQDTGSILSPFLVLAILTEFSERREQAKLPPATTITTQAQPIPQGYPTGTKGEP